MKKLILFFALVTLGAVGAKAQDVELDPKTIPFKNVSTVPGEDYLVTPVSGAWREFGTDPTGCDSGGANCTFGFEFTYVLNNFGSTVITTGEFATAALAFDSAQVIGFTAVNSSTVFSIPCIPCPFSIGVITINVALGSLPPSPPAASGGSVSDSVFSTADALLSVPDFSPCGGGGCELTGPDLSFDQFNTVFGAAAGFIFQIAYGCAGSSCIDYETLAQVESETIAFVQLDEAEDESSADQTQEEAPAENELLNPDKVPSDYTDTAAASVSSQTAQAIGGIMGEDNIASISLATVILTAQARLDAKREEFNTEIGAVLYAAYLREDLPAGELLAAQTEYLDAMRAYTSVEFQDLLTSRDEKSRYDIDQSFANLDIGMVIAGTSTAPFDDRFIADDSDNIPAGGQLDPGQDPSDPAEDTGGSAASGPAGNQFSHAVAAIAFVFDRYNTGEDIGEDIGEDAGEDPGPNPSDSVAVVLAIMQEYIEEALDAAHKADMEEHSVISELADIVVLAQSGPVKTYAAAAGPATIVTAFADTR